MKAKGPPFVAVCNSWRISIIYLCIYIYIYLYRAFSMSPNIDCFRVGAVPKTKHV